MDNVDVRFRVRATGTSQDEHGVTLGVEGPEGPENLRGKYLIAADGASSVIRITQGIDFPGLTFPELWLCTSTEFKFEDHFEDLAPYSLCCRSRVLVCICPCAWIVAFAGAIPGRRDRRIVGNGRNCAGTDATGMSKNW